jgi:hypothetical protein
MPNAYYVADFAANVPPLTLAMIRPGEDTSRNKHLKLIPCQSHANPTYPIPPHPQLPKFSQNFTGTTSGANPGTLQLSR